MGEDLASHNRFLPKARLIYLSNKTNPIPVQVAPVGWCVHV